MSSPGADPPYRVQFVGNVSVRLKELLRNAATHGLGEAMVDAVRSIIEKLETAPTDFGEPLYRLPALKLQVRVAIVPPLVAHYAVHEERPLVFVKGVEPLPGQGLGS